MKNFFTILAILFLSSGSMAQSVSLSRQTQGATFGEKVNAGLAVAAPGQPLYGIVVKVGKYATANTISVVTNAAGQFSFTVNEGGNYILNFQTGENPLFDNTGQAGANPIQSSALRATPGTPIGGIIVKGGKNPGGSFIILQSDEKGMLELPDLTPGTYTFKVTPKVVKATSSLKDTLKTQV